jgi:hypothetical protein
MAYRFQTLRAAFRSLAPALQAPQRKAGTPECTLLPAAQTVRRTATVADSKLKTTAQALSELYATAQPRKLQAVNNAVKSGFETLGSDMGNIRSDLDASVARLDAKVAVLDIAFCYFSKFAATRKRKALPNHIYHLERASITVIRSQRGLSASGARS